MMEKYREEPENTHLLRKGKYHCNADLMFDLDLANRVNVLSNKHKQSG